MNAFDRLHELEAENIMAGLEMQTEAGRFAALADRHENGTAPRAVSSFNLFQTPPEIAELMVEKIRHKLTPAATVLEPSAGLGRLYKAVRVVSDCHISLIEESADCCRELYELTADDKDTALKQADFLSIEPPREGGAGLIVKQTPAAFYDAIIMNPPFKQGRDIKHIQHALGFLKTGGELVALCYNGTRQNAKLKPLADTWEVLPEGSFKLEGTCASVALLTITKKGA